MRAPKITRKEFITSMGLGPLALIQIGLGLGGGCIWKKKKSTVRLECEGFVVDGGLFPLYSGSFHYWRHERELWPVLFDRLTRLGLNTVCTSIPWVVHEIERGRFDFGSRDKRKDVAAFIDLAAEKGFKVLVQPGPQINGEFTYYGLPQRVVFDPEIAARTSVDTVEVQHTLAGEFPVPSYFSEKFYEEVAVYFDALMPILVPRLHPSGGPVIGIQVDHEMSFFQRLRYPYTLDYHPSALLLYQRMLERKYEGRIEKLNRIYGSNHRSFAMVQPPRHFDAGSLNELPYYLDWVEFREQNIIRALERLARMFAERGVSGIPVFHCLPGDCRAPANIPDTELAEGIDLDGINGHPGREQYTEERKLCRAAAGMNLYPFRPEFGGGVPLEVQAKPPKAQDVEFLLLSCLMHGIKALNIHMAVERDRWLASPIKRDGSLRDEYFRVYQRIFRFLRESRFHEFTKQVEIIFLFNHGLDRLFNAMERGKAGFNLKIRGEVFAETVDFGFRSSPEACRLWTEQTTGFLQEVGFDWNYGSTRLPAHRLLQYRIAILPTIDFLYAEELATLEKYVQAGGILVFGPEKPYLNEFMQPDGQIRDFFARAESVDDFLRRSSGRARNSPLAQKFESPAKEGILIQMESPLEMSRLLKALEVEIPFTRSNTNLDLSLHRAGNGRKLLFVANGTKRHQKSAVFFTGSYSFHNLLNGETLEAEGKIAVELPPYSIAVWEVA